MKAATVAYPALSVRLKFQSTPPVKAATADKFGSVLISKISIHAAREGGDPIVRLPAFGCGISIHAAREGGDGGNV